MRQAMWERNTGADRVGRDSTASGAPMVTSGLPARPANVA